MRNGLSLGVIWEDAIAFFRAEAQLLLPIAFLGFAVPIVALQLAAPRPAIAADGTVVPGWWMLLFAPAMIGGMIASMAISALALRPGLSVGEALRAAVRRLPAGIGLAALAFVAVMLLSVAMSVVAGVEMAVRGRAGILFTLALLTGLVVFMAAEVRLMPIWAALVDGPPRPIAALRRSLAITRADYLRLLLLRIVAWVAQVVTMVVVTLPIVAVFAVIGRLTGAVALCEGLSLVAVAAIVSAILALWTVYVARLYRAVSSGI